MANATTTGKVVLSLCVLLSLTAPALAAANESTQETRLVVKADPRTGRLVRRVAAPPKPATFERKMLTAHAVLPLRDQVDEISRSHGVDPLLVHAVIHVESRYDQYAISPRGAEGLMQLIPSTARQMGVSNSFSTRENIEGGVKYLRQLMNRFSDMRHALAAYNAGPEAVARWGGVPPYAETRSYVEKVGQRYGELQANAALEVSSIAGATMPAEGAEPEFRAIESFIDEQGRIHLRTR